MKRFINFFHALSQHFYGGFLRFPETIIISLGFVISMIVVNRQELRFGNDIANLAFVLGLLIPLSVILKMIVERFEGKMLLRIIMDMILIAYMVIFIMLFPDQRTNSFLVRYSFASCFAYLILTLIFFLPNRKNYNLFLVKLLSDFLLTYLYTLVLYVGTIAIIGAIDVLFEMNFDEAIYFDLFIASVGLFGVAFFLGKIPRLEWDGDDYKYPSIWRVLFSSIVLPLISIYTIVLLAYFVNALFKRTLPANMISNLVIWYGYASIALLILLAPLKEENKLVKKFSRFYPVAMLIPSVVLIISISIRIQQYGFLPNRYLVLISGAWFVLVTIYRIAVKNVKSQYIVLSFIVSFILMIFTPINIFTLSDSDQIERLEGMLEVNGMYDENGNIVANETLDKETMLTISSQVSYLLERGAISNVKGVPDSFEQKSMEEVFGFDFRSTYTYNNFGQTRFDYRPETLGEINISQYSYHKVIRYYGMRDGSEAMQAIHGITLDMISEMLNENKTDFGMDDRDEHEEEPISLKFIGDDGQEVMIVLESVSGYYVEDELVVEYLVGHAYYDK